MPASFTPGEVRSYYSARLPDLAQRGAEWRGFCPIHKGTRDSFAVNPETGAWFCHSACARGGDVLELEQGLTGAAFPVAKAEAFRIMGRVIGPNGNVGGQQQRRIVATYPYCDEQGQVLFEVVRFEPKDFRQRRPDGKGGWIWNLSGVKPVLYRLPELLKTDPQRCVVLAEGERDVATLEGWGFIASCNPMGAGKWRPEYSETLRGRSVVVLPDADAPGRKHAAAVAESLLAVGVETRILELPAGKDATDWAAASGTGDELKKLVEAAPVLTTATLAQWRAQWEPKQDPENGKAEPGDVATAGAEPTPAEHKQKTPFHETDLGNAERLMSRYGDELLYCPDRGLWLIWAKTRWEPDTGRQIDKLANATIRGAYTEAGEIDDADKRKAFLRHLFKSEANGALTAMVARARSLARTVRADELDADPWLLNCPNGVVDLRTGEILQHDRGRLISKITGARYDPAATCPRFTAFIHRIMGAGPDASEGELDRAAAMADYLQMAFGYAATGLVTEKAVFVFHGLGNNGKTTLLEVVRAALGDYAGSINVESLMSRQPDLSVMVDLADLQGRRFVSTSEVEDGQKLAIARLKHLTGMGTLKYRRMRENFVEFAPTHKLFLDSNYKPVIRGGEEATWDRLHCVPFSTTIPPQERDRHLIGRLKGELPGILAWILEGGRRWQAEGLSRPLEVQAATDKYRDESDLLADFLTDRCLVDEGAWVTSSDLWTAYGHWCQQAGEKWPLSRKRFAEQLEMKGFIPWTVGGTRRWKGLNVR